MKRHRVKSVKGFEAAEVAAMAKKKAKSKADQYMTREKEENEEVMKKKEEKNEEVKKNKEEKQDEGNVINWSSWNEDDVVWPCICDFSDELMSWGSIWIPFLDEAAFTALYGDVVWDDDIWGLKKEIPIPSK